MPPPDKPSPTTSGGRKNAADGTGQRERECGAQAEHRAEAASAVAWLESPAAAL